MMMLMILMIVVEIEEYDENIDDDDDDDGIWGLYPEGRFIFVAIDSHCDLLWQILIVICCDHKA